jgi:hypothetical protein
MNSKDKCHVMIDLETYSLNPNAVIRSIGAVLFSLEGASETLINIGIDVESCLMAGLAIDQDTINFWRKQPEEYRKNLQSMTTIPLKTALNTLQRIAQEQLKELYVWSHGSNFDIVILENAYKAIGQSAWWKYDNVRDTRTLFDLADYKYVAKGGHDALEDAMRQAEEVCNAYRQLKGLNVVPGGGLQITKA